jgi:multicomponent Na+:H+ antiporter subunit G
VTALHAVAAVLCAAAVLLTLACSVGVLVMRDAWQRLHFAAPPATLGAALLTVAIAIEAGPAAASKPFVVLLLLTALNGVVTHALARAAFVRSRGGWPPSSDAGASKPGGGGAPGGRP